uniref:Uncharacterized protein n=1 Tax=Percolomonas cosmopolitus TaxID=63605 RepID=A0A7S1KU17_9EUKA|mmetsp:Transcript_8917/g.32907  ORF Transcript_8917/g.32907 Transcript_8917/m.32907 type:complete len:445 (+) Transcript_8917:572-1906(+)
MLCHPMSSLAFAPQSFMKPQTQSLHGLWSSLLSTRTNWIIPCLTTVSSSTETWSQRKVHLMCTANNCQPFISLRDGCPLDSFRNWVAFFVHLLKTLGKHLRKPIRLVVDLQFFKFHDSYSPLIHEVIDAMTFFFPSDMWNAFSADSQLIFLNMTTDASAQDTCKDAVDNVLSYIQHAAQLEQHGEVFFLKRIDDLRRHLGMSESGNKVRPQPLLPMLTLQPPRTKYEVQSVTVLGVKPREIVVGPSSILEIDPDTTVVKSEQRMIAIDEVLIGNGGSSKSQEMEVKITFHPVIQSATLFQDLDPHTSEKTYIFGSLEERDRFGSELFESAVASTSYDRVLSQDFELQEKSHVLKVMNSCLLIIEKKHRKTLDLLPLAKLQYARLDDQGPQNVKLKFLDEAEERHIVFARIPVESSLDITPGERLLELLHLALQQIQHVQDEQIQ